MGKTLFLFKGKVWRRGSVKITPAFPSELIRTYLKNELAAKEHKKYKEKL